MTSKSLLFALLFSLAAPAAHAACVDVSSIRSLVASGQVVDVRQVAASLRASGYTLRDAAVCEAGSGWVYRVVAEDQNGRFVNLIIDGRTGRIAG